MDRKICKSNNNNDKSPSLDNQIPLSEKSNENLQSSKHIQNITDSHNDNKPAKMMVESASVLTIEKEMQKLPIKSGSTLSFKSERIVNRKSNSTTSFPYKLHEILSRPELSHIISWKPHGRAWRVLKQKECVSIFFLNPSFQLIFLLSFYWILYMNIYYSFFTFASIITKVFIFSPSFSVSVTLH